MVCFVIFYFSKMERKITVPASPKSKPGGSSGPRPPEPAGPWLTAAARRPPLPRSGRPRPALTTRASGLPRLPVPGWPHGWLWLAGRWAFFRG